MRRPSWQIDLKWALGLAACLLLLASGVLYSLAQATGRDTAIPLSTALIATGINERVTDEEYALVQASATANPEAEASLSPVAIPVVGAEIAGLTKEQAVALVAGKLAVVLYEDGPQAADALLVKPAPDAEGAQKPISLGPAGALSDRYHSKFSTYFAVAGLGALVLLCAVGFLSRGLGRLGSPAFIVALASAPLVALWSAASGAVGPGDGTDKPYMAAARAAFRATAGDLQTTFLILFAAAFVAAALCFTGNTALIAVRRFVAWRRSRHTATEAEPDIVPPPIIEAPTLGTGQPA